MKLAGLLFPLFLVLLNINGMAAADAVAPDAGQELFFSQFRTAIHGEDVRQLMKLTHPQAKACTKEDKQEYYYGLILKGLVQLLGHQQTIKEIKSVKVDAKILQETSATASKNTMHWPIPPEQQLFITYAKENEKDSTATIYIARDGDQWKWVHLCYQE